MAGEWKSGINVSESRASVVRGTFSVAERELVFGAAQEGEEQVEGSGEGVR